MDVNLIRLVSVIVGVVSFRCIVQKKGEDALATGWFVSSLYILVICDIVSKQNAIQ